MKSLFTAQRRREARKEKLQITAALIAVVVGSSLLVPLDIEDQARIECTQLIGGWHPDIPTEKSEACK
jgi:hypothetical protein